MLEELNHLCQPRLALPLHLQRKLLACLLRQLQAKLALAQREPRLEFGMALESFFYPVWKNLTEDSQVRCANR